MQGIKSDGTVRHAQRIGNRRTGQSGRLRRGPHFRRIIGHARRRAHRLQREMQARINAELAGQDSGVVEQGRQIAA